MGREPYNNRPSICTEKESTRTLHNGPTIVSVKFSEYYTGTYRFHDHRKTEYREFFIMIKTYQTTVLGNDANGKSRQMSKGAQNIVDKDTSRLQKRK